MPKIVINTADGLSTNSEKGLHVKIDPAIGNRLTLNEDGLMVSPTEGGAGITLRESQYGYGIQVDWSPFGVFQDMFMDPDTALTFKDKVSCCSVIHRTWTAIGLDPSTSMPYGLTGKNTNDEFQQTSDWVFVGDFVRIPKADNKYDYYLITQVSANEGKAGNKITGIALLLEDGDDY